jgi:hypothetical protein
MATQYDCKDYRPGSVPAGYLNDSGSEPSQNDRWNKDENIEAQTERRAN